MKGRIASQNDFLNPDNFFFFLLSVTFLISNSNSNKNLSITKKDKLKLPRDFYAKLPTVCPKLFYSKVSSQTLTDIL